MKGKHSAVRLGVVVAMVAALVAVIAPTQALATQPDHITIGWGGCRGSVASASYIPNPNGPGFICADADYTNGNLGDGWAELDLVPQRLTTEAGTQASTTTSYDLNITADYKYQGTGAKGWDFIQPPVVNAAKSAASCSITAGTQTVSADETEIFLPVHITQNKGTTCVFDSDTRLALGAHLYPGSALHTHVRNEFNTTNGVGNKDNSIPVGEALPAQELSKTMTATQDQQQAWTLSKEATPTDLNLGDTCKTGNDNPTGTVDVTVTWTKEGLVPNGKVLVVTEVTASNPSHRDIQVDVSDVIYSGTTPLDTATDSEVLSGQTSDVVLHHELLLDAADAVDLNDEATATYTDVEFPDVDIPGETTATADATVVPSGTITNGTVDITDTESITGTGLEFSVADPGVGSFIGYTPGDHTTGPVLWSLEDQTDSGFVTFTKTIYFDGPGDASGTLSDEANLSIDGTPIVDAATASTTITSSTIATLTINKTTSVPVDADSEFTFNVTGPDGFDQNVVVTILAGEDSGSNTLTGLDDGDYTATETDSGLFSPADPQDFTINAGQCAKSLDFENTFEPATASALKVTIPAGGEQGVTFHLFLDDDGTPGPSAGDTEIGTGTQTDVNGVADFGQLVDEGDYYITEDVPDGYVQSDVQNCTFSVDYPADADAVFDDCVITNTLLVPAHARVQKVTDPAGFEDGFEFTLYKDDDGTPGAGDPNLDTVVSTVTTVDGDPIAFPNADLEDGDYYVLETGGPAGWESEGGDAGCSFSVSLPDDNDQTFDCVWTNSAHGTIEVSKTVSHGTSAQTFTFELRSGALDSDPGTGNDTAGQLLDTQVITADGTPVQLDGDLEIGTYQVCEILPAAGWSSDLGGANQFTLTLNGDNSRVCADFVVTVANQDLSIAVDNTPPPGGAQLTIGYWKTHSCQAPGRQHDDLSPLLPVNLGSYTVDSCSTAVKILSKQNLSGQNKASDPLFNMAAQLLAAELNVKAGAGTCAAATTAITQANALLTQYSWTPSGYSGTLSKADKTLAGNLTTTLDQYNNGLLC